MKKLKFNKNWLFKLENELDAKEVFNIGWYRKEFTLGEEYSDKRIFKK